MKVEAKSKLRFKEKSIGHGGKFLIRKVGISIPIKFGGKTKVSQM